MVYPAARRLARRVPRPVVGTGLAAGALLVLALAAYWPSLRGDFVWDDHHSILQNRLITGPGGIGQLWWRGDQPDYWPLAYSTHWIEWRLWGADPTGYRVANVLLHAGNGLLIWWLARRLVPNLPPTAAWLCGALFILHPVNVEAVVWILQRKTLLATLLALASLACWIEFEDTRRRALYGMSLGLFLLALLSKSSVVMLPPVLLLITWWRHRSITRRDLVASVPFFCTTLVMGLVGLWFQEYRAIGDDVVRNDGFASRTAVAGCGVWFYLFKALLPLRLSFIYPRWQLDPTAVVSYLPAASLIGLFMLLACYRLRWGAPLLAGLGFYVLNLVPALGFANIYFMKYSLVADHWQYLSLAGLVVLVVGLAAAAPRGTHGKFAVALAVVAAGLLGVGTYQRASLFGAPNNEPLWRDTLAKNPQAWLPHSLLAMEFARQGRWTDAVTHYQESLRLNPGEMPTHLNLGRVLHRAGRREEAAAQLREAQRMKPNSWTLLSLGILADELGRHEEALEHFRAALALSPDYVEAHVDLGKLLLRLGKTAEAEHHFQAALRVNPRIVVARHNLGVILGQRGDLIAAEREFRTALAVDPAYLPARLMLANCLDLQQRLPEAAAEYHEALKLAQAKGATADADRAKRLLAALEARRRSREP